MLGTDGISWKTTDSKCGVAHMQEVLALSGRHSYGWYTGIYNSSA